MRMKSFIATISLMFAVSAAAQTPPSKVQNEITLLMKSLADAALKSDPSVAEKIYDDSLIMTSQSGKVYSKTDAVKDLKNSFKTYFNDDLRFIQPSKDVAVVSYQNTRQRENLEEAKFRVTAVWAKKKEGWKVISIQSSKIVAQGM